MLRGSSSHLLTNNPFFLPLSKDSLYVNIHPLKSLKRMASSKLDNTLRSMHAIKQTQGKAQLQHQTRVCAMLTEKFAQRGPNFQPRDSRERETSHIHDIRWKHICRRKVWYSLTYRTTVTPRANMLTHPSSRTAERGAVNNSFVYSYDIGYISRKKAREDEVTTLLKCHRHCKIQMILFINADKELNKMTWGENTINWHNQGSNLLQCTVALASPFGRPTAYYP